MGQGEGEEGCLEWTTPGKALCRPLDVATWQLGDVPSATRFPRSVAFSLLPCETHFTALVLIGGYPIPNLTIYALAVAPQQHWSRENDLPSAVPCAPAIRRERTRPRGRMRNGWMPAHTAGYWRTRVEWN
jgi:hypothetical protein